MDRCHFKNAELKPKLPKYKGRVVLRGDVVKDNSGAYAVFTEQGSSASQMTAAKMMNVIARLPGCDGQAADAVSVSSQVKLEYGYVFHDTMAEIMGKHSRSRAPILCVFSVATSDRMCPNTSLRPRPRPHNFKTAPATKALALCLNATLGRSMPTVHRCPQGKAVGWPNSTTTRQQDSDIYMTPHHVCQTLTW